MCNDEAIIMYSSGSSSCATLKQLCCRRLVTVTRVIIGHHVFSDARVAPTDK